MAESSEPADELKVPMTGAVGLGIAAGVVLLGGALLAIGLFAGRGPANGASIDAGVDAYRPMVIGMPVFIRRATAVPVDEETLARAEAEDRAQESAASGGRLGAKRRAVVPAPSRAPERSTAGTTSPSGTTSQSGATSPPGTGTAGTGSRRTFTATSGPEDRAAAAAYRVDVQRTVQQRYLPHIQDCFDAATAGDPSLTGEITLGFIPADDGHVLSSRAIRDTIGAGVGACGAAAARRWQLPPPPPNALEMQMTFAL